MNVSDIMTSKPFTIGNDQTLRHALEMMDRNSCHHLPVLSIERHLVGILSDRDCRKALLQPIMLRETWQDADLAHYVKVRSVMSPAPIVTEPNAPAEEAARLMLVHRISCLPVMRSETSVGIVTKSDILLAFMKTAQTETLTGHVERKGF
jgi:CBS domain-containing protein